MAMYTKNHIAGCNSQYIRFPFQDFIAAQEKLGITKIDLVGAAPHVWCDHLSPVQTGEIMKALKQANLSVIAFTPKVYRYSLCAEPDSIQANATLAYYRNCLKAAVDFKCKAMVISPEGGCFDKPHDALWKNCRRMLEMLCVDAEHHEVVILISSVLADDSPILTSLSEVEKMLSQVQSNALNAMIDVNVISMCGESISQWFEQLGSRIRLVRFTDGNYNGYRIWGEGCLPCERLLLELEKNNYDGYLSLQLQGDRYINAPFEADEKNMMSLERYLR